MSKLLENLYNNATKALTINKTIFDNQVITKLWYGASGKSISEEHIKNLLQNKFPKAKTLIVKDVSGGCGAMFEVFVESSELKGMSIVKQHQAVTNTIKDEMKQIHGIRIQTKVPEST